MSWFTKIVKTVASWFKDPKTRVAFEQTLQNLQPYVQAALPVVEVIVALTPNRTDDELLAVAKEFGVLDLFKPGMSDGNIKNFLLDAGTAGLEKALPAQEADSATLRAAVDVALTTFKTLRALQAPAAVK